MKIKDILLVAAGIFVFWFFVIKKGTLSALKTGVNNATNNNDPETGNTTGTTGSNTNTENTNGTTNSGNTNGTTGNTNNSGNTSENNTNTGNAPVPVVEKVPVNIDIQGLYYSPGEAVFKVTNGKDVKTLYVVAKDQNQNLIFEKTYTSVPSSFNISVPANVSKLNIWYTTTFNSGGETLRGLMPAAAPTVLPVPVTLDTASQNLKVYSPLTNKFNLVWGARITKCTVEAYDQSSNKIYTKDHSQSDLIASIAVPANVTSLKIKIKTLFESSSGSVNALRTYNYAVTKNIAIKEHTLVNTTDVTVQQPNSNGTYDNLKSADLLAEVTTIPATPISPSTTTVTETENGNVPVEFYHLTPSRIIVGAKTDFHMKVPSTVKRLSVYVTDAKSNKVDEKIFISLAQSMGFPITIPNTTRLAVTTTASYQDGKTDIKTFYFDVIPAAIDYNIPVKIWDPSPSTFMEGSKHMFSIDSHVDVKKLEIKVIDQKGATLYQIVSEAVNSPIITGFYVSVPNGTWEIKVQSIATYKNGVSNYREFIFNTI